MVLLLKRANLLPQKTIVVAPLDWGIGHASRMIPVIRQLIALDQRLVIAAAGAPLSLLRQAFPSVEFIHYPAPVPFYGRGDSLLWPVLMQMPGWWRQYHADQHQMEAIVSQVEADAVISDNRFGAFSKAVPSVFVTHQIHIKAPGLLKLSEFLLFEINKRIVSNYSACWIPDWPGEEALSAALSQPPFEHLPCHWIGPLSRFMHPVENQTAAGFDAADVFVVLSGPEPQRSMLEQSVLKHFANTSKRVLIVRGLPGNKAAVSSGPNIRMENHLGDAEMYFQLKNAGRVIARAGYSTIMDLVACKRSAILIPTPGQPEQEYLAAVLAKKGYFEQLKQRDISKAGFSFPTTAPLKEFHGTDDRLLPHLKNWIGSL